MKKGVRRHHCDYQDHCWEKEGITVPVLPTKAECENGQVQVNRYDTEGLQYEMWENEKLLRFAYHQGELLYEEGRDDVSLTHHKIE